jgi:hypothetical protein
MSIFETKNTTPEQIAALLKATLEDGANWNQAIEASGIKYSRAWLIVRRAQLERDFPNLIVNSDQLVAAWRDANEVTSLADPKDLLSAALSDTVKRLHDEKCSWGEIMVRLGQSEGVVRKAFEYKTSLKSVGQRVGKGGRWVMDRGELYQENRKHEGAWIPGSLKRSEVRVEALANYVPKPETAKKVAAKRAAGTRKAAAKKAS